MLVKITHVNPLREDKRGLAYGFTLRESKYFVVLNRKKGTISGKHYHKGTLKSKSPELFYLAKGKIRLVVKSIKTGKSEEHYVQENNIIEIPAMVYHEVHALTDIILLEFNTEYNDFKDETADYS